MIDSILESVFDRMHKAVLNPGLPFNSPNPISSGDASKARGWFSLPVTKPSDLLNNAFVNEKRDQAEAYARDELGLVTHGGFAEPVTDSTQGIFKLTTLFGFQYPRIPDIRFDTGEKETALIDTELFVDCCSTYNASPRIFQQQMMHLAAVLEYPNDDSTWRPANISRILLEEVDLVESDEPSVREGYLEFRIIS